MTETLLPLCIDYDCVVESTGKERPNWDIRAKKDDEGGITLTFILPETRNTPDSPLRVILKPHAALPGFRSPCPPKDEYRWVLQDEISADFHFHSKGLNPAKHKLGRRLTGHMDIQIPADPTGPFTDGLVPVEAHIPQGAELMCIKVDNFIRRRKMHSRITLNFKGCTKRSWTVRLIVVVDNVLSLEDS